MSLCNRMKESARRFARHNPELTDVFHASKRADEGCVVRAVAHAVDARPTGREYAIRFKQNAKFHNALTEAKKRYPKWKDLQQVIRHLGEEDYKNILRLVRGIRTTKSPLGQALRGCDIIEGTMTPDELYQSVRTGDRIVADMGDHFTHLGIGDFGDLHCMSDPGKPPFLWDRTEPVGVLVFRKK